MPRSRSLYAAAIAAILLAASGRHAAAATLFVANTDTARIELYPAERPNAAPTATITKGIVSPYNIAMDSSGTLYVQNGDNTITEYARGRVSPSRTLAVTGGAGFGVYVAVGPDGTVYSANRGADEIYEFAKGGNQLTGILGLPAPLEPSSVAVNSANDIYIGYSRASVPGSAGVWVFPHGTSPGHDLGITLMYGAGIALDAQGDLLAGDAGKQTIDVYKVGASKPFRRISTAPYAPYQFAFDGSGRHLYVVGGKPTGVDVYDFATGKRVWSVSKGLSGVGYTLGVTLDSAGKW